MIPTKLTSSKLSEPWITNYIKRLTRRKQCSYNHALNLSEDWSKYYDLKRQCQHECRLDLNNYISTLVDPNSNAITKKLWSCIKSQKQDHTGVGPLNYQRTTITDPITKANVLADYFSSVFTREDTSSSPNINTDPLPSIPPIQIHAEGVAQLLRITLKHVKQVDPTVFPLAFLKKWPMK